MSNPNPLQKYFRQPKIFISLPSKGLYYSANCFQGDYTNVPIMAMTGLDEILMRTPDALFNGEATYKIIESCCPYVKNAKGIPSLDIDTLLMAIKIATYGPTLKVGHNCQHCGEENEYVLDLNVLIDHFQNLKFVNTIQIDSALTIKIKPLTYEQANILSLENFKLQKTTLKASSIDDEDEKIKVVDEIFKDLSELQYSLLLASIESVQIEGMIVTDPAHISEWLRNMEKNTFNAIKEKLEENKNAWNVPNQQVQCGNCQADNTITPVLDQSNFFV
jgi:hypothetical protein